MAGPVPNQLVDLLRALRRRRYQVLVPAALVATVGICFAVIVPKRYRVSMRIEIGDRMRVESDTRLKNPLDTAVRKEAPLAYDHIVNYKRVKEAVEANLAMWPEYVRLASENERYLFLAQQVMRNLAAQPTVKDPKGGGTIFIDVNYSDEDPARAAKLIDTLSTSWLREVFESDRKTLIDERNKYQDLIGVQQSEQNDWEVRLYKLYELLGIDPSSSNGESRRDDPRDWYFRQLDHAKTELDDVQGKLGTAEFELAQVRARLAETPAELVKRVELEADDPAVVLEKKKELLAALEEEIANLRPQNSAYKRLRARIDELLGEIREIESAEPEPDARMVAEENPLYLEYALAERQKEDEVGRLRDRLAAVSKSVEELTQVTKARAAQYQELDELENRVLEARLRVNQTRREWQDRDTSLQLLDASVQPWSISKPPLPAAASTQPNPWLLGVGAVIAGLALGIGTALLSELARSSYRSAADLAAVMSVPLLGAIETIVTRKERRRLQLAHASAALSTALIVGTLGWVTYLWYASPERLPLEVQDAIERLRSALK
jgi:capsular polysaccharide biosynthesis protein